jgi:radical SAM protein with 4Fe4S-binding SPASM domain
MQGIGTHSRVINGLKRLRTIPYSTIIARITCTSENNIHRSVSAIENFVDAIYWQYQNNPDNVLLASKFYKLYKELKMLLKYFDPKVRKGYVPQYIPFLCIIQTFLQKDSFLWFRCGCYKEVVYIDTAGNLFGCAEEMQERAAIIGNMKTGWNFDNFLFRKNKKHKYCDNCKVKNMCGGRCYNFYSEYYCHLVKEPLKNRV